MKTRSKNVIRPPCSKECMAWWKETEIVSNPPTKDVEVLPGEFYARANPLVTEVNKKCPFYDAVERALAKSNIRDVSFRGGIDEFWYIKEEENKLPYIIRKGRVRFAPRPYTRQCDKRTETRDGIVYYYQELRSNEDNSGIEKCTHHIEIGASDEDKIANDVGNKFRALMRRIKREQEKAVQEKK